jgi:RimJ/RimL family protein N-acetyltransferase
MEPFVDFQPDFPAETRLACPRDGSVIFIRAIRPDDEHAMVHFHEALSERSVAMRYFHYAGLHQRVAHERLQRVCTIDAAREMVLVATVVDEHLPIVGVGRMRRLERADHAEAAIIVADAHHRRGIGSGLLHRLTRVAHHAGLTTVVLTMLPGNQEMQGLCKRFGRLEFDPLEGVVRAFVDVSGPHFAPADGASAEARRRVGIGAGDIAEGAERQRDRGRTDAPGDDPKVSWPS